MSTKHIPVFFFSGSVHLINDSHLTLNQINLGTNTAIRRREINFLGNLFRTLDVHF